MDTNEVRFNEIDTRLNYVEAAVHSGVTIRAETSEWANHAAIADVATAISHDGISDFKNKIVEEVVSALARRMAERYDATRVEDNIDFLCDMLMDML